MYESLYGLPAEDRAAAFAALGQMTLPHWRSLTAELGVTNIVIDGVKIDAARAFDFAVPGANEATISMAQIWQKIVSCRRK